MLIPLELEKKKMLPENILVEVKVTVWQRKYIDII